MKTVALIMAGGKGERFWPESRNSLPKQFLCLDASKESMIQKTVKRITKIVNLDDVFIITNTHYKSIIKKQLPKLPSSNIILEPIAKNTAPAIEYSLRIINEKYDDAVVFVLPSDHLINKVDKYIDVLKKAKSYVETNEAIVTIGINANEPNTNYGYIKLGDKTNNRFIYKVDCFKEKPDQETAINYINSKQYLWNSGMFIFKASTMLDAFNKHLPEQYSLFNELFNGEISKESILTTFEKIEPLSIDYGVLEKYNNVCVIKSDFDWDDVGSWLAISRINKQDESNNVTIGKNVVTHDSTNTTIVNNTKRLITTIGVDNLVIVETDDVLFVANKDKIDDIKSLIKQLKENKKDKYL